MDILGALWEFGDWLLDALLGLVVQIINLALGLVEAVLMLLPDPASMPGLPLVDLPVSIGWLAYVIDFSAVNNLVSFMVAVELVVLTIALTRWLWGWIKW